MFTKFWTHEVECSLRLVKRENVPTPSHDHLHKLVHCPHIPGNIISYLPHLLIKGRNVCVCVCGKIAIDQIAKEDPRTRGRGGENIKQISNL